MKPANSPQSTPIKEVSWVLNLGTIRKTPKRQMKENRILDFIRRSLKKMGSRNVVKTGKVEKDKRPIATLDIWIE